MSRNIDDIATGDFNFPDAGKHGCLCVGVKRYQLILAIVALNLHGQHIMVKAGLQILCG